MSDLGSGRVLASRFTLKRRLGGHGATQSWLAADRMTRANVALKILADGHRGADLLRREWELSLTLVHPNIARVFEFEAGEPAFYSRQFLDGPDASVLTGAPADDSLNVIARIAEALRYAHGRGIVHRDIKAENILFDANGSPFLIDFGVAARAGEDPGGGSLIASSPQRLAGEEASPADDVFALGGLAYELLTGEPPYRAASVEDDILHRVPPFDSADFGSLPAAVSELLRRMLSKQAEERPSAGEVAETLREAGYTRGVVPKRYLASSASIQPEAETRIDPVRKRSATPAVAGGGEQSRSMLWVGAALAVLILLLLGVLFVLPKMVGERQTPPATVAETIEDDGSPAETTGEQADTGDESMALPPRDQRVQDRAATEEVLGELLAKLETLESRAVDRWGGLPYRRARATYEAGDEAYLQRDYAAAQARYQEALELVEPLLDKVDEVFSEAMRNGADALAAANAGDAISAYELAVAISENSSEAKAGLARARNLDTVLDLLEQGRRLERNLELDAARESYARAVELDPAWQPAVAALTSVEKAIEQQQFEARMSEGLQALFDEDFLEARAAFRRAQEIRPGAPEPADGLLQVDQALRLQSIATLEREAAGQVAAEQWEMAAESYEALLELDPNLAFAKQGLAEARQMLALFERIDGFIDDPDALSSPTIMQRATGTLIEITRMPEIGPRLAGQRDELSRLLKRAQTPLTVTFVSDNQTNVVLYKVGRLGTFETRQLELKPGEYTAVGSRAGYRDVRVEFRVAPEIDMQAVEVRCKEPI